MIHLPQIWSILRTRMPNSGWLSLQDIYELVDSHGILDDEDYEPQSPTSDLPKWKRNVRNVLQYRKQRGEIEWDGDAHYRFL